jgi:hypothetical protein
MQQNKMKTKQKRVTDKVRGWAGNGVLNEPMGARGSQKQIKETAALKRLIHSKGFQRKWTWRNQGSILAFSRMGIPTPQSG